MVNFVKKTPLRPPSEGHICKKRKIFSFAGHLRTPNYPSPPRSTDISPAKVQNNTANGPVSAISPTAAPVEGEKDTSTVVPVSRARGRKGIFA